MILSSIRRTSALLAVLALAVTAEATAAEGPWRWSDVPRVVAFGDVHGAYASLVELLQAADIVDSDLKWRGGATHVVSLGDLIDRGPESRRVLDLVIRLQAEAAAAGGRLHVVLGNHEVMNLMGDWRYLVAEDFAAFAPDETPAMRAAAYAAYAAGDSAATRSAFDRRYPAGYFARQAAFAPDGRYGAWLLSLPAIVVVDDVAFMHGGLPAVVADEGLQINARVQRELAQYLAVRERLVQQRLLPPLDRQRDIEIAEAARVNAAPAASADLERFVTLGDSEALGAEGPLWYRGDVYCKPVLEEPTLRRALTALDVSRAVVGHTPTDDRRVHALYDGRVVTLDTGMLSSYYGGRPTALVIENGVLSAHYPARVEPVATQSGVLVAYGLTAAELRAWLERAAVRTIERSSDGEAWQVTLGADGRTLDAWFYPRGRDRSADRELAAAALDRMLGTSLIAPAVARTLDGQDGVLEMRFPGAVTEAERAARKVGFSGWCPMEPQLQLMYTFDLLTANRGRTAANVLFGNDLTNLVVTDHRLAFGTERSLPPGFAPSRLSIPEPVRGALRRLDESSLTAALGAWLDARRIRALLARRDALLAE